MNLRDYIKFQEDCGFFFSAEEQKEINSTAELIYPTEMQKISNNKTSVLNEVEKCNRAQLWGCSDWRLPTVDEALKIVENHIEDIKGNNWSKHEFIDSEKGFFCINSGGYICSAYFVDPSDNGMRIISDQPKIYFDEFDMPHRNQARKILVVRGGKD